MAAIDLAALPDSCPVCQPGIPDAALPLADPEPVNGGTLAGYACSSCGSRWQTWFDRFGWPIDRLIAAVSPEQAERHRDELAAELRRSAA